jgi:hypothetical protein
LFPPYLKVVSHPYFRAKDVWFFTELGSGGTHGNPYPEIELQIGNRGPGQTGLQVEAEVLHINHGRHPGIEIQYVERLFLINLKVNIIFLSFQEKLQNFNYTFAHQQKNTVATDSSS